MKRATLLGALRIAAPALSKDDKAVMPALTHFCFEDDSFYAFNDQTAIIVGLKTGLTMAVHGETLLGVLGATRAEDLDLKTDGLKLKLPGRVELPGLSKKDFVFELPNEEPILSTALSQDMKRALEICLISVAEDSLKPEYNGVTLRIGKEGTVLFSTDNVTASRVSPPGKLPSRKEAALVLPRPAVEMLLKLFPSEGAPKIHITERIAVVDFGGEPGVTLVTKLLGAPSRRLDDVFAQHVDKAKAAAFPLPEGFDSEIEKAKVLTSRDPLKECTLSVKAGKLSVLAQGALGKMLATLSVEDKKSETEVTVNPEHVARILPFVKSAKINENASLILRSDGIDHIVSAVPRAMPSEPRPEPEPTVTRGGAGRPTETVPARKSGPSEVEDDDIPF